jgi:undecaprenyl-diphosphatase
MNQLWPNAGQQRALIWAIGFGVLLLTLGVLAFTVRSNPDSSIEMSLMDWVRGWSAPGLDRLMADISRWTDYEGRLAVGIAAIVFLIVTGRTRRSWAVALAVVIVALAAFGFDYGLGQFVERGRPISEPTGPSFPSGHTLGSTVLFGFIAFLAIRHDVRLSVRVPLVALMLALILMVGPSRVFLSAHWPTDVAAGYLVGAILLMLLVPLYTLCARAICEEEEEELAVVEIGSG